MTFGLADGTYGLAAFCASLLLSLFSRKLPRFALLVALFATAILALGGLYLNRFLLDVVPENNGYLVLAAVAACGLAGMAALFPRRGARRPGQPAIR